MAALVHLFLLFFCAQCLALAADISGIWMGQAAGGNPEKAETEDLAFQFKRVNNVVTGVMFGEEFDLPVEDLKVDGDNITFSITSTNYYSGSRVTLKYAGTVGDREMQLTRERKDPPPEPVKSDPKKDEKNEKRTVKLTRVTS